MLGHCFVMQYLVSFLVLQSSRRGRESSLLYFRHVVVSVRVSSLQCLWVVLQCVIVVSPGHTHLLRPCTSLISTRTDLC